MKDRSKYADLFASLQRKRTFPHRVLVDTVRGGGLRSRLEEGRYVGLAGLDYKVESHRAGPGLFEVYITVNGRSE